MSERARRFAVIAAEELTAARLLAPALPRQSAFFVQQAVEKLVKAALTLENIPFGKHHDLAALTGQLPDENALKADFVRLSRFTPYATEHRYPSPRIEAEPQPPKSEDLLAGIEEIATLLLEIEIWLTKRPPYIPR